MKLNTTIITVLTMTLISHALGHEDPLGEIHPYLRCTETGFSVIFEIDDPNEDNSSTVERVYDSSLKVLEDRILSEEAAVKLLDRRLPGKWDTLDKGTWYSLQANTEGRPSITARRPNGIVDVLRLQWPRSVGYSAGFSVSNGLIVIACSEHGSPEDGGPFASPPKDGGALQLYAFSLDDLSHIGTLSLGTPSRIWSLPCCSELIGLKSRFYLGWVRYKPDSVGEWKHELVVSEWNPRSSKHVHHVVDDDTTWNASLSMCECANQIVVAYHDQPAPHEDASIEIRRIQIQSEGDSIGTPN